MQVSLINKLSHTRYNFKFEIPETFFGQKIQDHSRQVINTLCKILPQDTAGPLYEERASLRWKADDGAGDQSLELVLLLSGLQTVYVDALPLHSDDRML